MKTTFQAPVNEVRPPGRLYSSYYLRVFDLIKYTEV